MAQAAAALSADEKQNGVDAASGATAPEAPPHNAPKTGLIIAPVPREPPPTKPQGARESTARGLPLFAAALCLTLGIGAALGTQIGGSSDGVSVVDETARIEKALPWKRDVAEIGARDSGKLRDELRALRSEVASLRSSNESQKQLGELRSLRTILETQKSDAAALKADVAARFDRADHDAAQRSDRLSERVDRMEKRLSDPTPTATVTKAPPPMEPKPERPVHGIVLRDVARGVALIESRRGMMEVAVGDAIPGAGRVEAIEKHAGKWRIVTTTGIIDDVVD